MPTPSVVIAKSCLVRIHEIFTKGVRGIEHVVVALTRVENGVVYLWTVIDSDPRSPEEGEYKVYAVHRRLRTEFTDVDFNFLVFNQKEFAEPLDARVSSNEFKTVYKRP